MKLARFSSLIVFTAALGLLCDAAWAKEPSQYASTKPVPRAETRAGPNGERPAMNERVKKRAMSISSHDRAIQMITHGWERQGARTSGQSITRQAETP